MWGALTKDFGEFVSTVAADTTDVLQTIDQKLDEPLVKGGNSSYNDTGNDDEGGDTTTEALIDPDTGIQLSSVVDDPTPTRVPWKPPSEASLEEMKERLVSCEDVFLDPLVSKSEKEEDDTANEDEKEEDDTAAVAVTTEDGKESNANANANANESPDPKSKPNESESNSNSESESDPVAAFLESFDVATKTEEISELLNTEVALRTTFSMLTDAVTYADFWTRYFYRIEDADRLLETYHVYYSKHLAAREREREIEIEIETAEAERQRIASASATMGVRGLSKFFGGVVTRLTHEDEGDDHDHDHDNDNDDDDDNDSHNETGNDTSGMVDESTDLDQTFDSEQQGNGAVSAAFGFLSSAVAGAQASGRPPFVMNTAVSDDDDDENQDDDEDSDVELGWDDDDEDDFEGLDEADTDTATASEIQDNQIAFADGDDRSETVDFKDAEKEGLLEDLAQARAERDALQKTVEMQAGELKKKASAIVATSPSAVAGSSTDGASESEAIQSLKLQLFERDAELAALKSNLNDSIDENDGNSNVNSNQSAEVQQLKQSLADKGRDFEAQVEQLKQTIAEKGRDFEDLQKATQEKEQSQRNEQSKELESLKAAVGSKDAELSALRISTNDESSKFQQKLDAKQAEKEEMVLALQSQIYALQRQVDEKPTPAPAPKSIGSGDESVGNEELEEYKEALAAKETELSAKDSEIATLRTQAKASSDELARAIASKDTEIATLRAQGKASSDELARAKACISENEARIAQFETELDGLQTSLEAETKGLQTELAVVQDELTAVQEKGHQRLRDATAKHETAKRVLEEALEASKEDSHRARKEIESLNEASSKQTTALQSELEAATKESDRACQELEAVRLELDQLKMSSPGSSSTGIKVDGPGVDVDIDVSAMPTPPTAAKAAAKAASSTTSPSHTTPSNTGGTQREEFFTPSSAAMSDTPSPTVFESAIKAANANAAISLGLEPSENDGGDGDWDDDW